MVASTFNIAGRNLPPPQSPFVDKGTLNLSYDGLNYLLGLLNDATSSLTQASVGNPLTATGANQATALQINDRWSVFTKVPANSGVLLAILQPGQFQVIFNRDPAGTLNIYPTPGQRIDSNAINVPYLLGPLKMQVFWTVAAGQALSMQLQVP